MWRQHVIASGLCRSASFLLQAAPFISFPVRPPRQGSNSPCFRLLVVVFVGRGWHPLLVARRRVARGPCSLLSCLDSMRSVSTMADSVMMSGLVFSFVVMFGKDRTALRVREDPFGGRDMVLICLGSALLRFQNRNLKSEFVLKSEFFRNIRKRTIFLK